MYRVLVVDDEEPVLESYEFMLKGASGFSLAGKARSGYEALTLIGGLKPDLVFMDINIPGKDGISVIAEAVADGPRKGLPVFILSTAYERFDLARRAIPLGVFDYLVKPVSKKTFSAALEKVRVHLDRLRTGPGAGEAADSPYGAGGEEAVFLRETLKGPLSEEEWAAARDRFALSSDRGLVCAVEIDEVPGASSEAPPAPWWAAVFAEKISRRYQVLSAAGSSRGLFLVMGEVSAAVFAELAADAGAAAFGRAAGQGWLWGAGGLYRGPELFRSREEALAVLEEGRRGADAGARLRLRIAQLRRKIGVTNTAGVREFFTEICETLLEKGNYAAARLQIAALFTLLIDDISQSWGEKAAETPLFDPAAESAALADDAAWEAWARSAFEKILAEATLRRSGSFPLPLIKAIDFINGHYAEGIQLGSAAEAAQVSPAYLSRLFSEHLKTNFTDYLTEIRLERGERLIRETALSIKEAAAQVGMDSNYFSKVFRKARGMSPSEYAEKMRCSNKGN